MFRISKNEAKVNITHIKLQESDCILKTFATNTKSNTII